MKIEKRSGLSRLKAPRARKGLVEFGARAEIKNSDLSDLQKRMALILLAVNGVDNAMRFVKLLQEQKNT